MHASRLARQRPLLHFSPPNNWMNDPNGLFRHAGRYHLYYQHNPDAPVWGNLHWGHASSIDLVDWDHHDVALGPDEHGEAFSGSIVHDVADTAGCGAGAFIAIYTQDDPKGQRQSIASSVDGGYTWTPVDENPVLEAPPGHRDFRDPKVLWHDGPAGGAWVMLLAVGPEIWIYRSADLRSWDLASTYEVPTPWEGAVVEVPDLVKVAVDHDEWAWLLVVSVIPPGAPQRVAGRVRGQFVEFDGRRLVAMGEPLALDEGRDLYALASWPADDDTGPIAIGWIDERPLADGNGTEWCGLMSLPRSLTATRAGDRLSLRQVPRLQGWTVADSGAQRVAHAGICCAVDARRRDADPIELIIGPEAQAGLRVRLDALAHVQLPDGYERVISGTPCREVRVVIDAGVVEVVIDRGAAIVTELWPYAGESITITSRGADRELLVPDVRSSQ